MDIETFDFRVVEKTETTLAEVMVLLHEYPDNFVHGLFEDTAVQDFNDSDTMVAYDGNVPVGCLMFNSETNEYNWLAVKRGIGTPKAKIAKRLFESFYPTIPVNTKVHFFVNTPDATIPDQPNFSGQNFAPARKLYESMGLEIKEANRVANKYGPGAHAYLVEWVPNKKFNIL